MDPVRIDETMGEVKEVDHERINCFRGNRDLGVGDYGDKHQRG